MVSGTFNSAVPSGFFRGGTCIRRSTWPEKVVVLEINKVETRVKDFIVVSAALTLRPLQRCEWLG